jgi:pyruvate/2-oxoglutarate/acetoin dehydrogenase E1 component
MKYIEEVQKGMDFLAEDPRTIFMGQAVEYKGTALTHQVKNYPSRQLLETPVSEEMQAGMALGLAIEGYLPVSLYPRMDFIILAMNQIVNHLDKWEAMSQGQSKPKVIMKAVIGSNNPLDPGHQHQANHTSIFKTICKNIDVVELLYPHTILETYKKAYSSDKSTLIIEHGDLYR